MGKFQICRHYGTRQGCHFGETCKFLHIAGRTFKTVATVPTDNDGPGELSRHGPRHDNDHADIKDIRLLPTWEELNSERPPYLPRVDPSTWHEKGLAGLIARSYRLLREETVGPIRNAVRKEYDLMLDVDGPLRDASAVARTQRTAGIRISNSIDEEASATMAHLPIPKHLRQADDRTRDAWLEGRSGLGADALICLIGSPHQPPAFCTVVSRWDTALLVHKPRVWFEDEQLVVCIQLAEPSRSASANLQLLRSSARCTLLEFPNVLMAGFKTTLTSLQRMSEQEDMAFANYLVPSLAPKPVDLAPAYSRAPGFAFDLTLKGDLRFRPGDPPHIQIVMSLLRLDEAQAQAVLHALSNKLALIQGPPGTGKSHVGQTIANILLKAQSTSELGPLIITAYTNHALDQFLESMLKTTDKIVRVGSRSMSEKLAPYMLSALVAEKRSAWKILAARPKQAKDQPQSSNCNEDSGALLAAVDKVRCALQLKSKGQKKKDEDEEWRQRTRLEVLSEARIIGVTTTGMAHLADLIALIGAKVLICEEAAQILEPHILTTFLPSIEHAILIGDHLQLRPLVQQYTLSSESYQGKPFSFDRSQFERLVVGDKWHSPAQFVRLGTQRRMHPSISSLIRPLYQGLEDGENVKLHPNVVGMRKRLFWFDHDEEESSTKSEKGAGNATKVNLFEIDMVCALARYLVMQCNYGPQDIAILTPYLGQLKEIQTRLSKEVAVVVEERDREALVSHNIGYSATPKRSMQQAVRVATVDNFQGEQAKVVIISLVRSNDEQKLGFLKFPNRINVMLSRAQHGMYIIGNAATARTGELLGDVVRTLSAAGKLGRAFELTCPRHGDVVHVSTPEDFQALRPEGGCLIACPYDLECGHPCFKECHSDGMHDAVCCPQPCERLTPGCSKHICPNSCGEACPTKCMRLVTHTFSCGHSAEAECWRTQVKGVLICNTLVPRAFTCGHRLTAECGLADDACPVACSKALPCGHDQCRRRCHEYVADDNADPDKVYCHSCKEFYAHIHGFTAQGRTIEGWVRADRRTRAPAASSDESECTRSLATVTDNLAATRLR